MKPTTIILILFLILLQIISCSDSEVPQEDFALIAAFKSMKSRQAIQESPQHLYQHYCSVCHGNSGEADGFNTFNLDPKPLSFLDTLFIEKNDSLSILKAISEGGNGKELSKMMPPYKHTLSKTERERLTSFILSLNRTSE